MTVLDDAETLWSYHQVRHPDRDTDIAIGLGSHDIGVPEHTADLYRRGRFPLIVFSGANAPTTVETFPRGEAVHFAERALELGVPTHAILIEPHATNTAENFTMTHRLLDDRGIAPRTATVICRPYQQRRALATARRVWPTLDVQCSARTQSLTEHIQSVGDPDRVLNMLVGDTQRIWVYADAGYADPQPIDRDTLDAYHRLVAAGYVQRLVSE